MRVTLSMLTFVPGGMGGSETYARELARELAARDDIELNIVVPANAAGVIGAGTEIVIGGVRTTPSTLGRLRAIGAAMLQARRIRGRTTAEVVHFPFTIPVPRPRGAATVLSVHDMQHRDLPGLFSVAERIFRRVAYEREARRATLIITFSNYARDGIIQHLGIAAERVVSIPHGVDAAAFTPNLGEREDFALYPARLWKHKNHAALLEAMALVREQRPGMRLVLTGGGFTGAALDALGPLPDWVDVRGIVPQAELEELYRTAAVLAFPSRYEGFGLPPLEAMASGCPVAASNAGSLPEVCGDAAVLLDPESPADIARGILEAIERRAELTSAGLERVREFTWERCAERHVAAYREAIRLDVLSARGAARR